jgi:hypothetical protein
MLRFNLCEKTFRVYLPVLNLGKAGPDLIKIGLEIFGQSKTPLGVKNGKTR